MQKTKILGTGFNGMVGSRIVELLADSFDFENMGRSDGVDISNFDKVQQKISQTDASAILHVAAKTDVDDCEEDKDLGRDGEAWKINVVGTKNIAEACKKFNKKLIYISTDFVFDGENPPTGGYLEDDTPNPINWYSKTKYEGELIVQNSGATYIIVRIAFPFRAHFAQKKDFMRAILDRLKHDQPVMAIADQTITPTFIDDIAKALRILIEKDEKGLYHVVGSESLSPYNAAITIAETFGLDTNLISKTPGEEFFKNRAPRPFHLVLSNAKIRELGIGMRTFQEALEEIKRQLIDS